jgi:hypothetical protein
MMPKGAGRFPDNIMRQVMKSAALVMPKRRRGKPHSLMHT